MSLAEFFILRINIGAYSQSRKCITNIVVKLFWFRQYGEVLFYIVLSAIRGDSSLPLHYGLLRKHLVPDKQTTSLSTWAWYVND
ncbi:hypothetical protein AT705_23245 [Pseudoalteromonas rubra]|uniref:Uncharacterized protein n=1 Tax=Pseudoalteromonas rubra TaxID=43658 RepID=A0A0U3I748_9GAMM|nr:hypothetical protein AT705_23245 [Pseudoalteromonas rubra]